MGLFNVVKTFSSSIGPTVTGALASRGLIKFSFLAAGALKATYDLGILAVFAGHVSREEKAKAAAEAERDAQNGNREESVPTPT
jgi:hypothetical protein